MTKSAKEERDLLLQALGALLGSAPGQSTLQKLSDGQGTETSDGKVWLYAKALYDSINVQKDKHLTDPAT